MRNCYFFKKAFSLMALASVMAFGQMTRVTSKLPLKKSVHMKKAATPLFAQNPNGQSGGADFVFSDGRGFYSADDFSLATTSEVKNMEFIGYQMEDNLIALCKGAVLYVYEDANGLPAGIPGKSGTPVFSLDLTEKDSKFSMEKLDTNIYSFLLNTTGFTAQAGKKYWIVFAPKLNTTDPENYEEMWNWFFSPDNHLAESQFVDPQDIFQAGISNWLSYYLVYSDDLGTDAKSLSFALYDTNYLATNESSAGEDISIFPNPATEEFHINAKNIARSEVYDTTGKLILSSPAQTVNISALPKGMYHVKIKMKDGSQAMKKLLKK